MKKKALQDIFLLRICIGYLGESDQYSWWASSFFSSTSSAFLSPVFSKTLFVAQYYGVKEAATIIHDDHIGIGQGVFHLFRMPETLEIEIHRLLDNPDTKNLVQDLIKGKDSAQRFLSSFGQDTGKNGVGPLRMGDTSEILTPNTWKKVAGKYSSAFENGNKIFPYFTTT